MYAKPSVNLVSALEHRKVSEDELPGRLIDDFSRMTAGLLPSIALLSLAAVRECAHMVLDRFCARLDPAFLAHRASLPSPDDAERQMVNHVAEELRGLMDYAVADQSPAGEDAITGWLQGRAEDPQGLQFGQKKLNRDQALALAIRGLNNQNVLGKNEFEHLSDGFAGDSVEGLDEELAWIITSRTVFNAPPPSLWLGTVVARCGQRNGKSNTSELVMLAAKVRQRPAEGQDCLCVSATRPTAPRTRTAHCEVARHIWAAGCHDGRIRLGDACIRTGR